jgi:hypothetical protein
VGPRGLPGNGLSQDRQQDLLPILGQDLRLVHQPGGFGGIRRGPATASSGTRYLANAVRDGGLPSLWFGAQAIFYRRVRTRGPGGRQRRVSDERRPQKLGQEGCISRIRIHKYDQTIRPSARLLVHVLPAPHVSHVCLQRLAPLKDPSADGKKRSQPPGSTRRSFRQLRDQETS